MISDHPGSYAIEVHYTQGPRLPLRPCACMQGARYRRVRRPSRSLRVIHVHSIHLDYDMDPTPFRSLLHDGSEAAAAPLRVHAGCLDNDTYGEKRPVI